MQQDGSSQRGTRIELLITGLTRKPGREKELQTSSTITIWRELFVTFQDRKGTKRESMKGHLRTPFAWSFSAIPWRSRF